MVETIPMTDDDIAWLNAYSKEVQDTFAAEFVAAEVRFSDWRRALARFTVQSLISDFREPLPRLTIHIVQVGELTQRPETPARIPNGPLRFSFGASRQIHRIVTVPANVSV